jgi:hypothetical protein
VPPGHLHCLLIEVMDFRFSFLGGGLVARLVEPGPLGLWPGALTTGPRKRSVAICIYVIYNMRVTKLDLTFRVYYLWLQISVFCFNFCTIDSL